jgi:hypothetical protein
VPGTCTDTNTDEANCGNCGDPCRGDQYCNAGVCSCTTGMVDCGGACINPLTDGDYCGASDPCTTNPGTDCRDDQVCSAGSCACPTGEEECAGACTDTQHDPLNCGGCATAGGDVCDAGEYCVDGVCVGECVLPNIVCGTPPACIDPQTNNDHCGGCDSPCTIADGFLCQGGTCQCVGGLTNCGGVCVNTLFDNANCGGCAGAGGQACTGGQYCDNGTCTCAGDLEFCGGNCVDTQSDEANCGFCGIQCNPDETCMSGQCVGAIIDHIEVTCPQSALPFRATMQCTAWAHYVGGNPAPLNVTEDADWSKTECQQADGCVDGDIIERWAGGLVDTVDSDPVTGFPDPSNLGDMASVMASYHGMDSNSWTVTLIQDYLCDVKIVAEEYDFEDFGKDQDFALPYLANSRWGLTWELIPVGIYKNDAACTQGGPYLRELTSGGDWSMIPAGVVELFDIFNDRVRAEVEYKDTYPAADATTTVIYNRPAQGDQGDNKAVSDELDLTVVRLTDTNWSLAAQPASLSIPDGKVDGFKVFMNFGSSSMDVTGFGTWHNWDIEIVDTAETDVVEIGPYFPWFLDDPMAGMQVLLANQGVGAASTTIEWSMYDAQLDAQGDPAYHQETVSIPVDVIDAVPHTCVIYLDDEVATSQIYPTSHPAVEYEVWACMSDDPDTNPSDPSLNCADPRNITAEDWGDGWQMVYDGTGGALGYVDAYGTTAPGSYHAPAIAPTNPNPENGYLRYQFGPDAGDGCQVEIRVRERYLCAVDVTTIPDLEPGEVQTTRRLWYPRAMGILNDEPLLNNIGGVTQQFFVYAEWGYLQGMHCAGTPTTGPFTNGYRTAVAMGDIDEWEYEDNEQHTDPIFGTSGINATTGIGTVEASTTDLDRVADIIVHVGLVPNDCDPVEGCIDTITVNACGVPFTTPERLCASSFSEEFEPETVDELTTYAGDVTKRYYAVQQFNAGGGCTFTTGDYWMDESSESYTTFSSQSTATVSVDNQGALNARQIGDTFISCNWNGGSVEDNMPIHVVGPLVKSFTFAPVGQPTNPRVVTYAPGGEIIPLHAQFFATATLTNGDVVDLATWVAANQDHTMVDGPELYWEWSETCDYFYAPTAGGVVTPNGNDTPDEADICTLTARCVDCGPQDAYSGYELYPGIDVFDLDPDEDDIIESSVEARAAVIDCARSGIQVPLLACEEGLSTGLPGYAIDNGVDSTMDLYYCIAYDNGIYRPVERFSDDSSVDWTKSGSGVTFANQSHGVISMNGGAGTVYAQFGDCTDSLAIAAGGTNYLQGITLGTVRNWNNCGTTADVCLHEDQSVQFVVTGDFGAGTMDLTTHSGVSGLPTTFGELPGFTYAVDMTVTAIVTATGDSSEDVVVEAYTEAPAALNVSVSDSSLSFTDYIGGALSGITGTMTLTGVTGITFDVTNDLAISPSDVTYFRPGDGAWESYNANWYLLPIDAGSASGMTFNADYMDLIDDDVPNISVGP